AGPAGPAGPAGAEYVGSQTCAGCHQETYAVFQKSGHAWGMTETESGRPPVYPYTRLAGPPDGYAWEDVRYVIGGYKWKAIFTNSEGYPITDAESQYNFANPAAKSNAGWAGFHTGEETLLNDCGSCHATGYTTWPGSPNPEALPGVTGTWAEAGVQCEACHGPGSLHAANPTLVQPQIERESAACNQCHQLDSHAVTAAGGFIQHQDRYGDLFPGKHTIIDCVTCHDPHAGVEQLRKEETPTTRTTCESCHWQQAQARTSMLGVPCTSCHMPFLIRNAAGSPETFTGDVRTHRVAIDARQIEQFVTREDGSQSILPQISLNYACRSCHTGNFGLSDEELIAEATGYHTLPLTVEPTAEP
ncbi:MAG: multiheme c-type cytochrome, partial [Chloroflexota bacterium]